MAITIEKPQNERKLLTAAFHAILGGVELAQPTGPNIHNAALQVRDAITAAFGEPTSNTGNRAWNWAIKTLSYALSEVLLQQRRLGPLTGDYQLFVEEFLNQTTEFENKNVDALAFRNPALCPIFDAARDCLPDLILKCTNSTTLEAVSLIERFNTALRICSYRVISENPEYFSALEQALTSVAGEAARVEMDWARHHHWISHLHTDTKVFSTEEGESTTIQSVYLRLRAFWNELNEEEEDQTVSKETVRSAHIVDLHDEVHRWLSGSDKTDRIRIVTGGPGSGKSSFARSFAHEVIQQGTHRVAFVRLQHTRLSGVLADDIGRYFSQTDNKTGKTGNPGLSQSPIELRKTDEVPLLLIFDGLDELTTQDEKSKKNATDFLLSLNQMLHPLNTDGTKISALVLGRNIACEEALKVANMPLKCMLNVAPIAPITVDMCRVSEGLESDLVCYDPNSLMEKDQRGTYWEKWAKAKGLVDCNVPAPLVDGRMSELNHEPLLLHLLVISRYSGEDWEMAAENRNLVYQDILSKIFDRNKNKQHFITAGVTEKDYFSLLECLGISAWRGNGRTGKEEGFAKVRKLHLNQEKRLKNLPSTDLNSVALNLHTRAGGFEGDEGFEFIHKSFGEYLSGRGIFTHGLRLAKKLEDCEPEEFFEAWTELFGEAELTEEVIRFLFDQAKCEYPSGELRSAHKNLEEFLQALIKVGAPAHKIFPMKTWRQLQSTSRCATATAVAMNAAFASAVRHSDEKKSEEVTSASTFRLTSQNSEASISELFSDIGVSLEYPIQKALEHIDFSHLRFWGFNFSRSNLENSRFYEAQIIRCISIYSSFKKCMMQLSNLIIFDCLESDFSEANMRGCVFQECNLQRTRFINTDLRSSETSPTNTTHRATNSAPNEATRFELCDMRYSNFSDILCSDLTFYGCNMEGATFSNINFKKSDFSGSSINNCTFFNCDLSESKGLLLTGMRTAELVGDTKLPKSLSDKGLEVISVEDWNQEKNRKSRP